MKKTILLADNFPEFLATRAEYLEQAGYRVVKAGSPEEARQAINSLNIHLAILDVRLLNDDDARDESGLDMARDPALRFLPSIIMTGFPYVDGVREALRPFESSAVDYLAKGEGPQVMVDAVNRAFEKHIHINWKLNIEWDDDSGLSIPGLIGMLGKTSQEEGLQARCEEVEDLLRMVFYDYNAVKFLRKLWFKNGRIALLVQWRRRQIERFLVLTFGEVKDIDAEIAHQDIFPEEIGEGSTSFIHNKRRAHYAANLWRLYDTHSDYFATWVDAADVLRETQFNSVVDKLVKNTLGAWRNPNEVQVKSGSPVKFYRQLLLIYQQAQPSQLFQQRVDDLGHEACRLNLINEMKIEAGRLRIMLHGHHQVDLPDPTHLLFDGDTYPPGRIYYQQNSPGCLDPDTILLSAINSPCLTDFIQAGEYPSWHDFAQLESDLRFHFIDSTSLGDVYELERQLCPPWPKLPRSAANTSVEKRKFAGAILRVRELAFENVQQTPLHYAECLLFAVAGELLGEDMPAMRNRKDVARLLHRLLLAGLICEDIEKIANEEQAVALDYPPLVVLEEDRIVRRGDEVLDVTNTEFRLLLYLYRNGGKSCERNAICRDVFEIQGEPSYNQLHGQVDSNLNRLRDKVELDPHDPHYILTDHGRGIRLVTKPGKR